MPKSKKPSNSEKILKKDIAEIVCSLHRGNRSLGDRYIKDLKAHSSEFSEKIQQEVLIFISQVYFQYDYDPWHNVTPEVQKAADRLIRHLQ